MSKQRIRTLTIEGYRPFGQFTTKLDNLEVIVGANGAGKTSLFEFLRFLRDGMKEELPSEIVSGTIGQEIFHRPGLDRFQWEVDIDTGFQTGLTYSGEVLGPIGGTKVTREKVESSKPLPDYDRPLLLLEIQGSQGKIYDRTAGGLVAPEEPIERKRWNQLMLGNRFSSRFIALSDLRDYIKSWRFYSSFNIDQRKIREAAVIEEEPLREDASISQPLFTTCTRNTRRSWTNCKSTSVVSCRASAICRSSRGADPGGSWSFGKKQALIGH
jgi:predicted ATPase